MVSSNLCEVVTICEVLSFTDKSIAFERLTRSRSKSSVLKSNFEEQTLWFYFVIQVKYAQYYKINFEECLRSDIRKNVTTHPLIPIIFYVDLRINTCIMVSETKKIKRPREDR